MKIIISPYSKPMRNGKQHPKNYPYWKELISMLSEHHLIQVGVEGEEKLVEDCRFNLKFYELKQLLDEVDLFISVDNFFHHFAHYYGKRGIVIFSKSDPLIFGYDTNVNILKDRKYLRKEQFWLWEQCDYDKDAFVNPRIVMAEVDSFNWNIKNKNK